ncbi:YcgL domain-containing protein [Aestuariibacter salexigens]|uniref:YcgL domain-containing protein n=1 Tax=Aestuariibacter salexigens TaxID=226010 RepID=UPI00042173CF|nr:YcgL domain-containing protein [Aestuariibacter salexigens]
MLCGIYKSSKKDETYLYLKNKDDFSDVPEALLQTFGKPQFVMVMPLNKPRKLALVEWDKLLAELDEKGYYLQLPPPKENLLKQHLEAQKKESD